MSLMDGSTIIRMLADYRVVLSPASVGITIASLRHVADTLAGDSPEGRVMHLIADAFSRSEHVVVDIPFDKPGDETGQWTTPNRDLVCRLEENGAEVL